jgi:hypothetical protein
VTVDNAQEILDILSLQSGSESAGEDATDEEAALEEEESGF